ncbi:MAG: asparagine synthase-related protein [Candidatus Acidiferrum sp.]
MSGILGILQRDGAPVTPEQLRALARAPSPAGWGAPTTWTDGPIGLGHILLSSESATEDNAVPSAARRFHSTADVRLDSRVQLRSELIAGGQEVLPSASDAELLLHSYAHWGLDCVQHMRGDFAFAIWDAGARTLFCARDHFGIKPFYYALSDSLFLFSNALNLLRQDPRVSSKLNDSAVADFLLFGVNCDNAATTFRDIQRLPPAHTLLVSRDTVQLRRYWEVPTNGRIRYARAGDYVENFQSVWNCAVADRLDADPTGLLLSGGLDSAAVAATAKEQALAKNNLALRAFTIRHQNLPADRDPQFASALANSLGIPLQCITFENLRPFEYWEDLAPISPEPVADPLFASLPLSFERISGACRALLSGEGSDNLMHFEMLPHAKDLARRGEWHVLSRDLAQFAGRRPFPWRGLWVRLEGLFGRGENGPAPFPKWIASDFAAHHDLRARWRTGQPLPTPPHRHPIHPTAHASLYLPQWTRMFELENPAATKCPVEVRYPFLDLRVVEYLLALPAFPWLFQKMLLREAMAGRVLDSVRLRPKTAFPGDPLLEQLRRRPFGGGSASDGLRDKPLVRWAPEAGEYINASLLSPLHAKMKTAQVNQDARPFCFNFWLQSVR